MQKFLQGVFDKTEQEDLNLKAEDEEEEPKKKNEGGEGGEKLHEPWSRKWWISVSVASFCAAWGGLMSGLTVGLLSIDELELELKAMTGTEDEKRKAANI